MQDNVDNLIKSLTPKQQRRMYLRFWGGLSYARIARLENITRQSAWESINRGIDKLKYLTNDKKWTV